MPEIPPRPTDAGKRRRSDKSAPPRDVLRDNLQQQETTSGERAPQGQESRMSDASSGEGLFAVSMEDVLAGLRLHDESQASRKELVGPPNSETIQRLRAAQAAAEQNSSTPSDIPPPTPRMKHLELPDSFIPAVDIGKRSQPPKPPRSIKPPDETSGSIDTRDIDKDIASFAFRVGKSEVARYLLGLPEPEK